jgi:2-dehydropantoate 2-reductase
VTSDRSEPSDQIGAPAAPDAASARRPIAVVGLGAVGSLLAACLAGGGCPVVVVRRTPTGGGPTSLRIAGPGGTRWTAVVEVVRPDEIPAACTVALLTVKQYDLAAAVDALVDRPDLVLVTVQNGLGAEERVLARRPTSGLVAASLTAAVERGPDGALRWLRRGGIGLAPVRGAVEAVVDELAAGFRAGGLPSRRYSDWAAMKWSKLLGNLVGNATSAILDLDPAAIYADPALVAVERAQLLEALSVMHRLGLRPVGLPGAAVDWLARVVRLPAPVARPILRAVVGGARGGKSPSLRGHVAGSAPGPSEVAWLNGAVAERARAVGLAAPVNRRLAALVEEVVADPAKRAWFRGRPDRLLAALAV